MNKKAITPNIATVLLIAFTIAILVVIFLWGKKYIEERALKEGKLSEKQLECENLDFTVVRADSQVSQGGLGTEIIVVLKNLKDKKIDKFVFRVASADEGEAQTSTESLEGLMVKEYLISFTEAVGVPESVEIRPWLKVARKVYVPCSNKVISAKL